MPRVYYVCVSEHIFSTRYCPFDGWENPHFLKVEAITKTLTENSIPLTIQALVEQGLSEDIIKRLLIIDFGNKEAIFEGLQPGKYFYPKEYPKNLKE